MGALGDDDSWKAWQTAWRTHEDTLQRVQREVKDKDAWLGYWKEMHNMREQQMRAVQGEADLLRQHMLRVYSAAMQAQHQTDELLREWREEVQRRLGVDSATLPSLPQVPSVARLVGELLDEDSTDSADDGSGEFDPYGEL